MQTREESEVIVIGGGPGGLMAAGRAAERGRSVILLEKNPILGRKLLITGGGRCNVTNNKPQMRTMLSRYEGNDKYLYSAFSQFGVDDTLAFFHERGMATKEESEGRVFPATEKSESVLAVLAGYASEGRVHVRTSAAVTSLLHEQESGFFTARVKSGLIFRAGSCVLAAGGLSRPETGSTGDWIAWLRAFGHTVIDDDAALVPVALKDEWAKKLGGVTLDDVKLTTFQSGVKQDSQRGKLLFTHFGVSGPTILNMSREIGELMKYGEVTIRVDLFPALDHGALRRSLQELLVTESNRKLKNSVGKIIPSALASSIISLARIDGETPNHSVRTEERGRLVTLMKELPLSVQGLLGLDKAVVSSGGVALDEVNFKTMESRIVPRLFLVGDVLNVDRPSGGYSLQLCWTSGFVAGNSC